MGVDTLFVQLSSFLTEIWPTNELSVMAALICIKIVRGTFCQLVNIANRFLRIFSNLETLIRFIFPGGAGYPYLPTQLDAGLVLSNVQVLQQLVTSMCRTSSDLLLAAHGRQPFPSSAIQQAMPSYGVLRVAHYMMAMGLWRPPVETFSRTPMSSLACNACTSCQDCCPRVPR